ncbi:hypothetical protein [Mangrovimonas spongiae]|uniref:Lipocalin-like domain-containing protein n=1 Tax=Mangrovimonas spongiae TaxID=2494697 RepID=A0A428K0E4_9FLAO|nr:hypothetical protein [Mangrovimonas spongiae]RSK39929.1 hypothetical protein EJA19_08585 [Mangrovimonas spongiae]
MLSKSLLSLFLCIALFSSCSSDDDNNDQPETPSNVNIYDKWWYDSEDFAADIYFHSNGQYEQRLEMLGNTYTATGDWFWLNEDETIMKIENLVGDAQGVNEGWFKFTDKQNTTITIQQALDGENYSGDVIFNDVD